MDLVMDDGNVVEIRIEYNWVPKKCSSCKEFGHLPSKCKKPPRQSWVPKAPLPKPVAGDNSGFQASSGIKDPTSSASLPGQDSLVIQMASGGSHSCAIIPSSPAGLGAGGSSSNAFALLQGMDDDHGEREDSPSGLHLEVAGGVSASSNLNRSGCLSPTVKALPTINSGLDLSPKGSVSPSSPSSYSCTPLLARKLVMVDELEKKQGKQIKSKKKSRSAGNSKGKNSLFPDD